MLPVGRRVSVFSNVTTHSQPPLTNISSSSLIEQGGLILNCLDRILYCFIIKVISVYPPFYCAPPGVGLASVETTCQRRDITGSAWTSAPQCWVRQLNVAFPPQ